MATEITFGRNFAQALQDSAKDHRPLLVDFSAAPM
jgi:hypothetical protein